MKSLHIFLSVFLCLLLLLLLSVSTPAVCGQVHIQSTCYNSEAMVTESVMTNNADYFSVTVLLPYYGYVGLPYSIRSNGAGKSVDEEFSEFAHSIYAGNCENFENIAASLKTESESGGFEWKGGVTVFSEELSMGMSVGCEIENGNLEAFYRNSLSSHTEELMTNGARYSESTIITPNAIDSNGVGNSLLKQVEKESKSEDDEADEEKSGGKNEKGSEEINNANNDYSDSKLCACKETELKNKNNKDNNKNQDESADADNYSEDENVNSGFSHKVRVESQGKCAEIRTNLTCESMYFAWGKSAQTLHQDSSMGMVLEGGGKNGSVKILEMDGEASKFPHLHLPPGEVVITTVRSETDQPENNQADISESVNEFYEDFSENPTALFYSIEQECFIHPGRGYQPPTYDIGEGEYFQLNMGFFLGQDENGEG